MSKINFSFLRNKFFLAGLLTGVVVTALVFILIISSNYPPPSDKTLKGTISGNGWIPSVGSTGVVTGSGNDCGYIFNDVVFENDPDHNTVRCHSTTWYSAGVEVECYSSNNDQFCQGGGASVGMIPTQY